MEGRVVVERGTAQGRSAVWGGEGEGGRGSTRGEDSLQLATAITAMLLLLLLLLLACHACAHCCASPLALPHSLTTCHGRLSRPLPCHGSNRPPAIPEGGGEGGG